jgi:hypothetical protein
MTINPGIRSRVKPCFLPPLQEAGWPFVDKQIIDQEVEKTGLTRPVNRRLPGGGISTIDIQVHNR